MGRGAVEGLRLGDDSCRVRVERRARQATQSEENEANEGHRPQWEWKPDPQKTLQRRAGRNRGFYAQGPPRLGRTDKKDDLEKQTQIILAIQEKTGKCSRSAILRERYYINLEQVIEKRVYVQPYKQPNYQENRFLNSVFSGFVDSFLSGQVFS